MGPGATANPTRGSAFKLPVAFRDDAVIASDEDGTFHRADTRTERNRWTRDADTVGTNSARVSGMMITSSTPSSRCISLSGLTSTNRLEDVYHRW